MDGPDPREKYPMPLHPRVGFLKPLVDAPNIEIGDYTYYDDPGGPENFVERCVLYHYTFIGDRLVIGRFCALAGGVLFIMNGANHAMAGFSTFPFNIFGGGWESGFDASMWKDQIRGDTIVGNDVWIGIDAVIMPGINIGHGAIIAGKAVVSRDVPPYAIAAGNSARIVKMRFDNDMIKRLLDVSWWDWPADKITRNLNAIRGADIEKLESAQ